MRSQLDCHDHRLPGTGVFDLKTRAALPIRMDLFNYEVIFSNYNTFLFSNIFALYRRIPVISFALCKAPLKVSSVNITISSVLPSSNTASKRVLVTWMVSSRPTTTLLDSSASNTSPWKKWTRHYTARKTSDRGSSRSVSRCLRLSMTRSLGCSPINLFRVCGTLKRMEVCYTFGSNRRSGMWRTVLRLSSSWMLWLRIMLLMPRFVDGTFRNHCYQEKTVRVLYDLSFFYSLRISQFDRGSSLGGQTCRTHRKGSLQEQASFQGQTGYLLEFTCRHEQGTGHGMGYRIGLFR